MSDYCRLAKMEDFEDVTLSMSPDCKMTETRRSATAVPSQGSLFTNFEDVQLTDEERVYLNAAALGDVGIVRQSVEENDLTLNLNCVDYMGRNALHLAIDSEKIDVIEVLLDNLNFNCIEEALLHAISKGATKVVKIIIEHPNFMAGEDRLKQMGGGAAFFRTEEKSQFSPDVTPLILSAHYNNHEIIQMFLSRNHTIEKPHPISCNCTDCVTKQNYDSLKRSRSRLNAYRALASPAYMALSSPDPIMTTFELRQEMMKLAEVEKEFKSEYLSLVEQCMNFACELMDLCRGTQEVEAVLSEGCEPENGKRDPLARLKMAIRYEEKKFVAHPNCQQHMTTIWYGSEMGFLQSLNWLKKVIYSILFVPLIPFFCVTYVFAPTSKIGAIMRCPVTKFMTHTMSHMCFLILLAAATFRITESDVSITSTDDLSDSRYFHLGKEEKIESLLKETLRPANTLLTHVQICIVFWILGLLWIECKQVYGSGARGYVMDNYNFMDFIVLSMYLASYVLRFFTDHMVSESDKYFNGTNLARELLYNDNHTGFTEFLKFIRQDKDETKSYFMEASRFQWKPNDPEIVSDVLFAIANVISFARTTYLMPAFEVLGPLQISLGRMIGDITRFMVLFTLVLFAFMVGLHNLYWYYGAQRIKMVLNGNKIHVYAAQAFRGLQQTFYSLFWSMFGQVSVNDIMVKQPGPDGIRKCLTLDSDRSRILCTDEAYNVLGNEREVYTPDRTGMSFMDSSTSIVEAVGTYMFGLYHVVIIIVLINMLIAMMSHSFEDIQTDCDVEWKFARTKLWMNYMDEGSTLPVPFNMLPTPKSFCYAWRFCREMFVPRTTSMLEFEKNKRQTFIKKRRETVCKNLDLKAEETSYADIMQRLVRRYLFKLERAKDESAKDSAATIAAEAIEIVEAAAPDYPPPDPPSKIPFATPVIQEGEYQDRDRGYSSSQNHPRKKSGGRMHTRRSSISGSAPLATTVNIPQLDAIQRSQKLLDVRLQHLQSSSKENSKLIDDVEFIRRLMTENQKALFNIIQALSNIQGEIVNLAQCLRPTPPPPPITQNSTSAHPRRRSREDESKMKMDGRQGSSSGSPCNHEGTNRKRNNSAITGKRSLKRD